jgi:hypothetical protein
MAFFICVEFLDYKLRINYCVVTLVVNLITIYFFETMYEYIHIVTMRHYRLVYILKTDNVTSDPHTVTSDPQTVIADPYTVTSDPYCDL